MLDLLGSDVFMSFSTTVAPDSPLKCCLTLPYLILMDKEIYFLAP